MKTLLEKIAASDNDRFANPPVTVAFIGDSVTQGCFEIYKTGENTIQTVFEPQNAYSEKFKTLIRTVFPRAQINIVNAGISGDSAPSGLKRLERDALSFSPDLLVVCFGLNDSTRGESGIKEYENALESIFERAKKSGAEVVFMTPNMMATRAKFDSDEFLYNLNKSISEIQTSGMLDKYVSAAKRVAKKCNVKVCDAYAKWKALDTAGTDITELLCNGVNHPSRDIHWFFAQWLFDTVFFE